jgi:hypothetical protein
MHTKSKPKPFGIIGDLNAVKDQARQEAAHVRHLVYSAMTGLRCGEITSVHASNMLEEALEHVDMLVGP